VGKGTSKDLATVGFLEHSFETILVVAHTFHNVFFYFSARPHKLTALLLP